MTSVMIRGSPPSIETVRRFKMMQWWADYLDTLRQRGRVVLLKAVTA
jgi:hypothetical protein